MRKPLGRSIICELCNQPRRTRHSFDVCFGCTRKLQAITCDACHKRRFQLQPDSPICHGCLKTLLKEKISCAACGLTDYAFTSDPVHCRKCHRKVTLRIWKESWSRRIICSTCGKEKRAWKKTGMTCIGCHRKQRSGNARCLFPGCDKLMFIQKSQLCSLHHDDQEAPRLLRDYLDCYTSPFPHNERYMSELASTINWEAVTNIRGSDLTRLRAFGRFLQTYELPEVLTWDAIDLALPASGQFIRSCLFQLGDVLAERGKMQGWESHLSNGGLRRSLQRTPVAFLQTMTDFQQWLVAGKVNPNLQLSLVKTHRLFNAPRTIAEQVNMVVQFLNFCASRNIGSLPQIGPTAITQYQQTILWQFECKKCRNRIPFTSSRPTRQCVNPICVAIDSYVRTRRSARGTLITHMSALRLFFDWARLQKLVEENPFLTICCGGARTFTVRDDQGEMFEVAEAIRRYDDAVVEKLCAYIVSPNAEPEEAIVLYLIIFHFLTNGELRNLRIPSLVNAGSELPDASRRAEDFEYLHLPLRQLTRGNRVAVRTDTKIIFPRKALSWLTPILKRFYEKRAALVKAQHKQHFLVVEKSAFCNKPVTKDYVARLVRRASIRALGEAVSPSDLRRTAADMFAQRSKRRGAILTTMGFSSLSATRFNYLERFPLQPKATYSTKRQGLNRGAKRQ